MWRRRGILILKEIKKISKEKTVFLFSHDNAAKTIYNKEININEALSLHVDKKVKTK